MNFQDSREGLVIDVFSSGSMEGAQDWKFLGEVTAWFMMNLRLQGTGNNVPEPSGDPLIIKYNQQVQEYLGLRRLNHNCRLVAIQAGTDPNSCGTIEILKHPYE